MSGPSLNLSNLRVLQLIWQFADSRQAYADLPDSTKDRIANYVLLHSQHHSRRVASPGHPMLEQEKYLPTSHPFGMHRLVQEHEASGRTVCLPKVPCCIVQYRPTAHIGGYRG